MKLRPDRVSSGGDMTNYLQESEKQAYSAEGVEAANERATAIERSKARLSGKPVDEEEAARRVRMRTVGYNVNPSTGDAVLPSQIVPNQTRLVPATQRDVELHIEQNYPAVAAAAKATGLSYAETLAHTNFVTAVDAATQMATTYNPARAAQVYAGLDPSMQGLVGDILTTWWEDAQQKSQVVDENSTGNAVTDFAGKLWGYTGSPLFDFLWDANQFAMRVVNTTGVAGSQWATGNMVSYADAWKVTEPGTYNVDGLNYAREEYGADLVDTILEIRKAAATGDDDAIGQLYEKYSQSGQYDKLSMLDALLFGVNADQRVQDAATYVDSMDVSNVGNNVFWGLSNALGVDMFSPEGAAWAQTPALTVVRDTTNIVSTFAFDPTIGFGKAVQGYKAARYGLRLLAPGKIDKAFANPNVRRFFDTLGDGFRKYDDAGDLGQKAQVMNSLRSQYKGWFKPEALDELHKAGVYTADDALEYFRGAENVRLITNGQTARRGRQIVIPHMMTATAQVKRSSLVARGLTYDANAGAKIDEIFGAGVSQMLPEEAIPVIIKRLSETDGDKFVGRMLSDFVFADGTAKRTFLGSILKTDKYGYKRKGDVRSRAERASRTMAHVPNVGDGLWISDARDAQTVRDLMLYAGMPKYWADLSADLWKQMSPAQRIRFASGMGRSAGYAVGVDIVDPVSGKALVDNLVMGLRNGELYAPDMQDLASLRGQANRLAADEIMALARAKAGTIATSNADGAMATLVHGTSQELPGNQVDVVATGSVDNPLGIGFYAGNSPEISDFFARKAAAGVAGEPVRYKIAIPQKDLDGKFLDAYGAQADAIPQMQDIIAGAERYFVEQTGKPSGVVVATAGKTVAEVRQELVDGYVKAFDDLTDIPVKGTAPDAETARKLEAMGMEPFTPKRTVPADVAASFQYRAQLLWVESVKDAGFAGMKGSLRDGHQEYIFYRPPAMNRVNNWDDDVSAITRFDDANMNGLDPALVQAALADDGFEVFINDAGNLSIKRTPAYKALHSQLVQKHMAQLRASGSPAARMFNPSRAIDEQADATNGLFAVQMTDRIAMPDLQKMDQLAMRQSYLTALLGTNPFMTTVVDAWTLGTLAGPRFQMRNGLEDAGLYAVTGGSWKGYRAGRMYGTAKHEATARGRQSLNDPMRREKLGSVKAASRWLGDHMPTALQGIIWPNLTDAERAAAQTLANQGDRSGIVTLINKAMLRGAAKYTRGRTLDPDTLRYLDEASEELGFFNMMDEVSESARHLADGIPPGVTSVDEVFVHGQPMRMMTVDKQYATLKVKRGDPRAVKAWWNNLSVVLHGDRGKGQAAVARIRAYHAAKLKGDTAKQQKIVKDFAKWIEDKAPWVQQQSGIAATEGVESFARRNLDAVLNLFTSKSGGFNNELFEKIRRVDVDPVTGDKKVTYALWDDAPGGGRDFRVFEQDLAEMKARPQTVLDMDGIKIPVTTKMPLNQRMWAAMGRSLARMTREPIFISNYLDARKTLAPFEARIAQDLGEAAAKKWAVEAAYERAYHTSMAYIDNPAIRSQMAWNVRNVARFYRALEDFNRRMIRVAKYQPAAFEKIHLTWRVLDDTGFVSTDEYGDKYFIWPGSRLMFQAVNKITSAFGLPVAEAGLPMAFTSRVSMLTPSADPNSWFPTMSSPYATLALAPLMQIVPGLNSLQQEVFGEYSAGQPIWESIIPPNVMRPFTLVAANLTGEEARRQATDDVYASAARSAIQAYAAAGLFDESQQLSPKQIEDMRRTIDVAALDIMALKTVLAPSMPAAIQATPDTVTDFARSVGVDGMREAFVQVLKAHDGDIDAAYVAWLTANPGRSIFTVSANTNGDNIGNYAPFRETVQWIEANKDVVDAHPVGAAFFAPQEGTQNLAAWSYLRAMGAKVPKSVERYFNEVATAQGYSLYRVYKKQYEDGVAAGRKKEVEPAWENAKRDLYARFPMLQSRIQGRLGTTDFPSKSDSVSVMDDYRGAVRMMEERGSLDERGWYAQQVVSLYDQARSMLAEMSEADPNYDKHRTGVRDMWMRMIADMKTRYVGDRQWESLLYTSSGALGFEVEL